MRAGRIEIGNCSARRSRVTANATARRVPTPATRCSGPTCMWMRLVPLASATATCATTASVAASVSPERIEVAPSARTSPRRSPSSALSRARLVDIEEVPRSAAGSALTISGRPSRSGAGSGLTVSARPSRSGARSRITPARPSRSGACRGPTGPVRPSPAARRVRGRRASRRLLPPRTRSRARPTRCP